MKCREDGSFPRSADAQGGLFGRTALAAQALFFVAPTQVLGEELFRLSEEVETVLRAGEAVTLVGVFHVFDLLARFSEGFHELYGFRFGDVWNRKWLAIIGSWLAVNIWISTVYLRHHWVVDIFAGWIVAAVAYYAAGWVRRTWQRIDAHCEAIAVEDPPKVRMVAGAR